MKKIKITITSVLILVLFLAINTTCFGVEKIYTGSKSEVDATYIDKGYINVRYLNVTEKKLKVIIQKDSEKYTYDLNNRGEVDTFPLQMGNGKYKISIFENISSNKYVVKQTVNVDVKLNDENSPFLVKNQLVNFSDTSETVKKAQELTEDKTDDIEKIGVIYDYIISNIVYDTEKAKNVQSGYLPKIDEILKSNKGICYDYASVMASMLRSQSIPTKLVTGYSSKLSVYHAWNEVYTDETGWIALNEININSNDWNLMDSTVASSGKQSGSPKVMEYTNKLINKEYYTKQFEY